MGETNEKLQDLARKLGWQTGDFLLAVGGVTLSVPLGAKVIMTAMRQSDLPMWLQVVSLIFLGISALTSIFAGVVIPHLRYEGRDGAEEFSYSEVDDTRTLVSWFAALLAFVTLICVVTNANMLLAMCLELASQFILSWIWKSYNAGVRAWLQSRR